MATHSNICAGKFHGQRSLAGYSPWGLNELDTAEETNILLCHLVMYACMLSHFRHVRIYAPPWTAAHQAPMSTGFSRQEYWSGLPFPFPPFSNIHVEYLYFNINQEKYIKFILFSKSKLAYIFSRIGNILFSLILFRDFKLCIQRLLKNVVTYYCVNQKLEKYATLI